MTLRTHDHHDLAIVGAGILGVAHAYLAIRAGLSVVMFDRHPRALGASVRNFGMLWPIGQLPGKNLDRALRSRQVWADVAKACGLFFDPVGSLHVARAPDELAVLEEFVQSSRGKGYVLEMLTPDQAVERSPALVRQGLLGAMFSQTEVCVDPRVACALVTKFLVGTGRLTACFSTPVRAIEHPYVETSAGERWRADRILVCSGDDLRTLYPAVYADSGLTPVKLQMQRTAPQPGGWRMGPMLAGGLTLQHYPSFRVCASLGQLRARFARERPEFNRFGIHVLASQHGDGSIAIGDSHMPPEDDAYNLQEIDDLVLKYFHEMMHLPEPRIAQRWHGVYARFSDDRTEFIAEPEPGVRIVNGPGGAGMTLSFGLAQDNLQSWSA